MDAAIVSIVKELEHISSLNDQQTIALKAFLEEKHVSALQYSQQDKVKDLFPNSLRCLQLHYVAAASFVAAAQVT